MDTINKIYIIFITFILLRNNVKVMQILNLFMHRKTILFSVFRGRNENSKTKTGFIFFFVKS